jgi:hypothetical protein
MRHGEGIKLTFLPPLPFVPSCVVFGMMDRAKGNSEFKRGPVGRRPSRDWDQELSMRNTRTRFFGASRHAKSSSDPVFRASSCGCEEAPYGGRRGFFGFRWGEPRFQCGEPVMARDAIT